MRISDWSSDVCSSDLLVRAERAANNPGRLQALVTAASDKYDDGLVDAHTLVGIARVLVAPLDAGDDDDDDSDAPIPAVRISDVREDEGELRETAVQAQAAAKPNRSCTRVALTSASGAAKANGNVGDTLPAGPPAQPELANS